LAPFVLWPITVVASIAVVAAATLGRPASRVGRVVWAVLVGIVVLAANHRSMIWAVVAAALAMAVVAWSADDRDGRGVDGTAGSDPPRPRGRRRRRAQ
jgi:hypothetical protein